LGIRDRLIPLAKAAALGTCCNLSDIPYPVWGVAKLGSDEETSLASVLMRRLSTMLSQQVGVEEHAQELDHAMLPSPGAKHKRDREMAMAHKTSADDAEQGNGARDKRRRFGLDQSEEDSIMSPMASHDREFDKSRVAQQPAIPLIQFLADACLTSMKDALACQTIVEHASDHPYVRTASNSGANSRRCLHMDGCWALMVVFDSRCTLLPGESLRFFSDLRARK